MKTRYITVALALLATAGCSWEKETCPNPGTIVLGVEGIGENGKTRAVVDKWDDTEVALAYAFGLNNYTDAFAVTVSDNDNGRHVNTGIAYPDDDTQVSFVGYHPVSSPQGLGEVSYNLTGGDVDLMYAAEVSGKLSDPITGARKLDFEHLLTRVTFRMRCKPGEAYPEPVMGVQVTNADAGTLLNTRAALTLSDGSLFFYGPGTVLAGDEGGSAVPTAAYDPLIIDAMVQPDVPLAFAIHTLTGLQNITITDPTNAAWVQLSTLGGEAGMQYIISLQFSGAGIIDQGISIVDWKTGQTISSTTLW